MGIEAIVKQLDTRHDLDRIKAHKPFGKGKNYFYLNNFYLNQMVGLPKHMIRGAVAGGALGAAVRAIVSSATGNDVGGYTAFGAAVGPAVGAFIDMMQFLSRGYFYQDQEKLFY